MGISLKDSELIEIDTYFEVCAIFNESFSEIGENNRQATQKDIDNFLI